MAESTTNIPKADDGSSLQAEKPNEQLAEKPRTLSYREWMEAKRKAREAIRNPVA
jgi:hypothetical protein